MQYGEYFPSFSYFATGKYEKRGEYFPILHEACAITTFSLNACTNVSRIILLTNYIGFA